MPHVNDEEHKLRCIQLFRWLLSLIQGKLSNLYNQSGDVTLCGTNEMAIFIEKFTRGTAVVLKYKLSKDSMYMKKVLVNATGNAHK